MLHHNQLKPRHHNKLAFFAFRISFKYEILPPLNSRGCLQQPPQHPSPDQPAQSPAQCHHRTCLATARHSPKRYDSATYRVSSSVQLRITSNFSCSARHAMSSLTIHFGLDVLITDLLSARSVNFAGSTTCASFVIGYYTSFAPWFFPVWRRRTKWKALLGERSSRSRESQTCRSGLRCLREIQRPHEH